MMKLTLTGGFAAALLSMAVPKAASAAVEIGVSVQLPHVQVVMGGPGAPPVAPAQQGPQGPAPGPGYTWEPERWEQVHGRWVKQGGYWRPPAQVVAAPVVYEPQPEPMVEIDAAPPAPVVEVRPALPYAGAVWIPGSWVWARGRHHWVTGRWSAPRPGYVWVASSWNRRGHRWASAPGHWQPVAYRHDHRGWDRHSDRRGRHDDDRHRGREHHGRHDRGHHR